MEQQAKFQAIYNGEIYQFHTGAHLYIFDCGLFWDMDKDGMDEFKRYIDYVYYTYLKSDNPIPLGSLSDYIAEHWTEINEKNLDRYEVLDKFWMTMI